MSNISQKYFLFFICVIMMISTANASDTRLMFVGEDLEILSIASRKEEAAWNAPAIAKVITQVDLEESGALTIAQAIDDTAGFHIEETNEGSIPYLRGIPNSMLLLYDTVPVGSGAEKSNHLIDYETSLASIKRIEIIRGAGSVLWGPDAFSGVVNAVPLTGKDFSGAEIGSTLTSDDKGRQAYLRFGKDTGTWASFFSASARHAEEDDTTVNVVQFWNDGNTPAPVDQRFGNGSIDDSYYIDLYGNISYSDWLTFSVKLSESQKAYSVTDWDQVNIWEEQKSYYTKLFKMEVSHNFGIDSGIRFTGYYSDVGIDRLIVDREFDQKEYSWFGEIIYDRLFFSSNALLTVGTSIREDHFDDILVWDTFFPGFFVPTNESFLPQFSQNDYRNTLLSVFSQYRHKVDNIDFWA